MELKDLILRCVDYLKAEPIVAAVVIVILALLFYFRRKAMFKIVAIFLVMGFVYYLVTLFGGVTDTGVSQKEIGIEKSLQ